MSSTLLPKHVYVCYANSNYDCDNMDEVIDIFITSRDARKIFFQDIIHQNSTDQHFDVDEVSTFRMAIHNFEYSVEWMFDHNYNNMKVLRRIPAKVLKSLNHARGASQFVLFEKVVRKDCDFMNEQRMIDVMI